MTIPIQAEFDAFIDRWKSHAHGWQEWVGNSSMQVYIRYRDYWIGGTKLAPCIVIANIEVNDHLRGQGMFTRFLSYVEGRADALGRTVVVENIANAHLRGFLERRGYKIRPGLSLSEGAPPTVYREVQHGGSDA
jgi:GNAT superfamily N-acetyltransferase